MRALFLGGGTGGHLASGVAVAEVLRRQGHEALFVIAGRPVEHALLGPREFSAEPLFGDRSRPAPWRVDSWLSAAARWRTMVRDFDPDVIVVLGGWVALPAVVTGFFGRPSVLVEQNARPGKVMRMLAGRVEHACLARSGPDMPRGRRTTLVTGSPSPDLPRRQHRNAADRLGLDPDRRTLLLMGGSQGAADLNALLPSLATVLAASGDPWQVYHITGGEDRSRPTSRSVDEDVPVLSAPFEDDMASAYAMADVAVCRAGAATVSELCATGTPSVLVPYPHHADRHQEANAMPLVEAGGAFMVGRDDPTGRGTAPGLLKAALDRLPTMSVAARSVARPDAAEQVASVVLAAASAS